MPKIKNMFKQAERMLVSQYLSLTSKHAKSETGAKNIHSISTLTRYKQALGQAGKWAHQNHGIARLNQLSPETARDYLRHRVEQGIGQKQLDNDRAAMQFVVGNLDRIKADHQSKLESRAYTKEQAERIADRQSERNCLASKIAYDAGLRAHELLTLRRIDEATPSNARQWRSDLFQGRSGDVYVVKGKGGLSRQVLISHELSRQLEARRFNEPQAVKDRGINYQARYDIGGGNAWSKSFSKASMTELGRSNGAHGLRHAYAQDRLDQLHKLGYSTQDAKQIISQELGHFRESVVAIYLR